MLRQEKGLLALNGVNPLSRFKKEVVESKLASAGVGVATLGRVLINVSSEKSCSSPLPSPLGPDWVLT